jgi:hypothetical protein
MLLIMSLCLSQIQPLPASLEWLTFLKLARILSALKFSPPRRALPPGAACNTCQTRQRSGNEHWTFSQVTVSKDQSGSQSGPS